MFFQSFVWLLGREKSHCCISLCTGIWFCFILWSMKRRQFWCPGRKVLFHQHHQRFRQWSDGASASAARGLFCYPRKLCFHDVPYLCCALGLAGISPLSSAVSVLNVTMCSTLLCLISLIPQGISDNFGCYHWLIWSCTVAESTGWSQWKSLSCYCHYLHLWSSQDADPPLH